MPFLCSDLSCGLIITDREEYLCLLDYHDFSFTLFPQCLKHHRCSCNVSCLMNNNINSSKVSQQQNYQALITSSLLQIKSSICMRIHDSLEKSISEAKN